MSDATHKLLKCVRPNETHQLYVLKYVVSHGQETLFEKPIHQLSKNSINFPAKYVIVWKKSESGFAHKKLNSC